MIITKEKLSLFARNSDLEVNKNGALIIEIQEGMADQIRSYSLGVLVQVIYNKKVKYDISWYGENINGVRNHNRDRNLELLNICPDLDFEIAKREEIDIYKSLYYVRVDNPIPMEDIIFAHKRLYFWGHPKEFFSIIEKTF